MSNCSKKAALRCALLMITAVALVIPTVSGALGAVMQTEMNKQSAISDGLVRPAAGETRSILLDMRARKDAEQGKGTYGKPIFSELVSFDIFPGFDLEALREDIRNLDLMNEDEQKVIDATYISVYKQVLVIKLPMGYNGASFGAIFLGDKITSLQTVRHEYGHTRQLRDMGLYLYVVDVAIPSILGTILDREDRLPYDYYGSYWEAGADELGHVSRSMGNEKWPTGADSSIWKLCAMFD